MSWILSMPFSQLLLKFMVDSRTESVSTAYFLHKNSFHLKQNAIKTVRKSPKTMPQRTSSSKAQIPKFGCRHLLPVSFPCSLPCPGIVPLWSIKRLHIHRLQGTADPLSQFLYRHLWNLLYENNRIPKCVSVHLHLNQTVSFSSARFGRFKNTWRSALLYFYLRKQRAAHSWKNNHRPQFPNSSQMTADRCVHRTKTLHILCV